MNPIKKQKDDMRAVAIERRHAISDYERALRDGKICAVAESLVSFRYSEVILLYAPTKYEIDVMPIAEAALRRGKKVAFPRCDTENHTMDFHFIDSCDELVADAYGILAPPAENPVYSPESTESALCFVPGVLFDKRGFRIGYGKGFYDRYLSAFSGSRIGVVYSDFICQSVPAGRFDISCDILLTEGGVKVIRGR